MAKGYYMRTMVAGRYRKTIKYSRPLPSDQVTARRAKRSATMAAQKFINIKNSEEKLKFLLCANFDKPGLSCFCTFTFDEKHLPANRKHVISIFRSWIPQARAVFKARGQPFPYIYNVEGEKGSKSLPSVSGNLWETAPWLDTKRWEALDAPEEDAGADPLTRLHVHCFLNLRPEDYLTIAESWHYGKVHICPMRVDDMKTFSRLASYVLKDNRKNKLPPGDRSYIPSLNLEKPRMEGHWCSEAEAFDIPADAEQIKSGTERDDIYGIYSEYVYFRLPRPSE